jgi:hypothetical protein
MDPNLMPKINSKWVKDLNTRPKCKIHGLKYYRKNLHSIVMDNDSLDITSKVQITKAKIDKKDCIKHKTSAQQKKQSAELKKQPIEREKYSQTTYEIRGYYQEYIKNS